MFCALHSLKRGNWDMVKPFFGQWSTIMRDAGYYSYVL